jgi:hypothetical protein
MGGCSAQGTGHSQNKSTFPEGIADGRPEFWECPVPRGLTGP